jgi:phosphoribosylformylglycinamidine synthase
MAKSSDVTRNDTLLFSESNGRILVSVKPENVESFKDVMKGCECAEIGEVTSGTFLKINGLKDESVVDLDVEELKKSWKGLMNKMH